ncbi:MAG TPA: hypothetical protein VMS76_11035 [Planctomycetota bacterium]|nr:hypothetical protein [Planctomycetota bacterium]
MRSKSRIFLVPSLLSFSVAVPLLGPTCGSDVEAGSEATAAESARPSSPLADQPLAGWRTELLDLAFESASAMPLHPHVKNRSRAQETVVEACFELDQPQRALGYVERIENWRRGAGYAEYAFYCAAHGSTGEVQHYLDLALRISETTDDENPQDWHRDRIRAKVAKTHVVLGRMDRAAELEVGLLDSESGELRAAKADLAGAEDFDGQVEALDRVVASGSFDPIRGALQAYARLFERFYDDQDRRSRVEQRMAAAWDRLPLAIRIELTMDMARSALDHGDRDKALELIGDAKSVLDGSKWTPEHGIPLVARLAELRSRAGDEGAARKDLTAALARFEVERDLIVDIYRAGALRALAEAYQGMGDAQSASRIYGKALEEGVHNPNSRPRAEDLSATCVSMALHGFEPEAELRARMLEIHAALGPPW